MKKIAPDLMSDIESNVRPIYWDRRSMPQLRVLLAMAKRTLEVSRMHEASCNCTDCKLADRLDGTVEKKRKRT